MRLMIVVLIARNSFDTFAEFLHLIFDELLELGVFHRVKSGCAHSNRNVGASVRVDFDGLFASDFTGTAANDDVVAQIELLFVIASRFGVDSVSLHRRA